MEGAAATLGAAQAGACGDVVALAAVKSDEMSIMQLVSWREIGQLEVGEGVIVLEPITVVHADLSDPDPDLPLPDLIVPANTSAVVDMNTLFENGIIALKPDDLGLRAELHERGLPEVFFVPAPFGNTPPPEESECLGHVGTSRSRKPCPSPR
jgi:hypothetical protein